MSNGTANIASFFTPQSVQMEIAMFGTFIAGVVSSTTKTVLTTLANDLLSLASGDVTIAAIDQLIADAKIAIPVADQGIVNFVLTGVLGVLNLILNKFGSHNPQIVSYINAVANGILEAGL